MQEDRPAQRVVLVGMMGVGKSSIGREVALRLGWPYYDNDERLVQLTGSTAAELLDTAGEPALRRAESEVIRSSLLLPAPCIIGVAAGAILDQTSRRLMRDGGTVLWLRAQLSTLADRLGSDTARPWLQPDPLTALTRLNSGRDALYQEASHAVVDVDGRTVEEIVEDVIRLVAPTAVAIERQHR